MHFTDDGAGRLVLRDEDQLLAEYVYAPTDPPVESPRPYALLRSRGGAVVTAYRPADHVWHKGLSLALPVVGAHNFWGGPTYVRGDGYVQLPNNGAQRHRAFRPQADPGAAVAAFAEDLDWVAEDGQSVLAEKRVLTARIVDETTWVLTWRSVLRNVSGAPLAFGSPTTKGRPDAGYAGIFWRGPTSFTGGEIRDACGAVGHAALGTVGPWLSFVAPDRSVGVLLLDASPVSAGVGTPWFARSEEYAGLGPAPFFSEETTLAAGDTLTLAAVLVVGGAGVASLAESVGAALVAEQQSTPDRFEAPE